MHTPRLSGRRKQVQRAQGSLRQGRIYSVSLRPALSMCVSLQMAACEQPCTCVLVRIRVRELGHGGVSDGEDEGMSSPASGSRE